MQQKLRTQILYNGLSEILGEPLHTYLHQLSWGSWWNQWVVMASHHCYSWWSWWSDTLWETLIRLWLHSLSCYLQIIIVEISLQFYKYICVSDHNSGLVVSRVTNSPWLLTSSFTRRLALYTYKATIFLNRLGLNEQAHCWWMFIWWLLWLPVHWQNCFLCGCSSVQFMLVQFMELNQL